MRILRFSRWNNLFKVIFSECSGRVSLFLFYKLEGGANSVVFECFRRVVLGCASRV